MLILDYESLRLACCSGVLEELCRSLLAWPEHTVLASTWFARQEAALGARDDEALQGLDADPHVVWLSDLTPEDLFCLQKWQVTLVPREGPEAGRNASAAAALAYAEARGSVAVLADRENVEVALTVSPATRTLWLPALLGRLTRAGLDSADAIRMLGALRDSGADWEDDDMASLFRSL